jgi:HEAT repeat protein
VAKLKRREKIDGLRDALRYRDIVVDDDGVEWDLGVGVRLEAAEALSHFEAPEVAADLGAALDDPEPDVRLAVIDAVARVRIRVARVREKLLDRVVSREPGNDEVAARALDVLVEWRNYGTVDALVERLLEPAAPELDEKHREALDRLLDSDVRAVPARESVADRLVMELRGDSRGDRTEASAHRILSWLGPAAVEKVLLALDDERAAPALVRAAGRLGDARAVGPVVRGLSHSDAEMREAAAVAARMLNHTRAVPALLTATQDDEQAVRDAASAALDRMGTAAVIAGLAAVVSARGLLGVQGSEIDGLAGEELRDGDGAQELEEADAGPVADAEPITNGNEAATTEAASASNAAPAAAPATPTPAATPPYRPPGGRRRGGLLDRLLGRDY